VERAIRSIRASSASNPAPAWRIRAGSRRRTEARARRRGSRTASRRGRRYARAPGAPRRGPAGARPGGRRRRCRSWSPRPQPPRRRARAAAGVLHGHARIRHADPQRVAAALAKALQLEPLRAADRHRVRAGERDARAALQRAIAAEHPRTVGLPVAPSRRGFSRLRDGAIRPHAPDSATDGQGWPIRAFRRTRCASLPILPALRLRPAPDLQVPIAGQKHRQGGSSWNSIRAMKLEARAGKERMLAAVALPSAGVDRADHAALIARAYARQKSAAVAATFTDVFLTSSGRDSQSICCGIFPQLGDRMKENPRSGGPGARLRQRLQAGIRENGDGEHRKVIDRTGSIATPSWVGLPPACGGTANQRAEASGTERDPLRAVDANSGNAPDMARAARCSVKKRARRR